MYKMSHVLHLGVGLFFGSFIFVSLTDIKVIASWNTNEIETLEISQLGNV